MPKVPEQADQRHGDGPVRDRQYHSSMDPLPPLDEAAVRDALRGVVDPELGDNIVDLGMVDGVEVRPGGAVMEIGRAHV